MTKEERKAYNKIYGKKYRENYREERKAYNKIYNNKYRKEHLIECREATKKWYLKHKEQQKERLKKWYIENRKRTTEKRRERETGMSASEYEKLFIEQNGVCYICSQKNYKKRKEVALVADHFEDTSGIKKPRKLLCDKCNLMIGLSGESYKLLERAAAYLREFNQ